MPPGWCRQGRAAGQDQGQWSGGMTCVGMSKRMLYAYAILLLSLLRRCWTCYAEDALSTINNMAMAMAAGRRTAGPAGHSIGLLVVRYGSIRMGAESAESGEPENELRTHSSSHRSIARMMTHDGKTFTSRARAPSHRSASHRHAMAPRIAGSRAGNRKACECEWRHAGHAGVGV